MKKGLLFTIILSCLFFAGAALAENPTASSEIKYAGSFFGMQVPLNNYYFIKATITVFGNKFGQQPKTAEEEETYIWDQLLLSYEAFRRGVTVSPQELNQEIDRILKEEKTAFDRKIDPAAYEKWVKEKTGEGAQLFENQIQHLLQVEKLRQQVMGGIAPVVSEAEARHEFRKEYNTLVVELAQFAEKKGAEKFYLNAKRNPGFWQQEKEARPKDFKRIGPVSGEFLIDLWGFPADETFKMVKQAKGAFYPAIPIYKGYGVCRIEDAKPADEKEFTKVKESYYEQVSRRKKYEGLDEWFKGLKKQANINIYL